ncbi:hypothetical protein ACFQ21_02600 [Ohtaekwangia kribbensis]|uniref:Uncharacterized protein n=1 Tax=Ohtaekwangia kribbensis TaxID=688913 RepID=A0ABW3JZE1_9BACT
MKSRTFKLFLFSGAILLGTILTATFWDSLELGTNKIRLAVTTTIAFGISIAGLIVGIGEIGKQRPLLFWIGFVGHIIVIGVFAFTITYAIMQ